MGGPISDRLGVRLAVGSGNHDGYTRVMRPDPASPGALRRDRTESRHDLNTRLSLVWRPTQRVRLDLVGDYYRANDQAVVFHVAGSGYDNSPDFAAWVGQGQLGPRGATRSTSPSSRSIGPRRGERPARPRSVLTGGF